jgi:two-component system nitrogen regulation response regulator GlnG
MLINHHWPGNVRELKNIIKRAVLLAESMIEPSHLIFDNATSLNPPIIHEEKIAEGMSLREVTKKVVYLAEKEAIERALIMSSGNKSKAAKILRVDYKTLLSKIKEYEIRYGIDCMESVP